MGPGKSSQATELLVFTAFFANSCYCSQPGVIEGSETISLCCAFSSPSVVWKKLGLEWKTDRERARISGIITFWRTDSYHYQILTRNTSTSQNNVCICDLAQCLSFSILLIQSKTSSSTDCGSFSWTTFLVIPLVPLWAEHHQLCHSRNGLLN